MPCFFSMLSLDQWEEEKHKRDANGRFVKSGKSSQSAIKSVKANIRRGQSAMNTAIAEKRTVHRAMYHNAIGWIDFEWGDDGLTRPFKKGQPVGKGIAHIIEARMRKDGMSYKQVTKMLTDNIVKTIARGKITKTFVSTNGKNRSIQVDYEKHRVSLAKNKGSNAWMVTAFEVFEGASR